MEKRRKYHVSHGEERQTEKSLPEMIENPDAYTEEEILCIINRNEDSRETYKTMVEIKQSYRYRRAVSHNPDIEKAWQRFRKKQRKPYTTIPGLRKVAAIIISVIVISGIAIASIYTIIIHSEERSTANAVHKKAAINGMTTTEDTVATHTGVAEGTETFDNVRLDEMLPEIAQHYKCTVKFDDERLKELRLYFQWNPQEPIEKVIEKLNLFERLTVMREGDCIIVKQMP